MAFRLHIAGARGLIFVLKHVVILSRNGLGALASITSMSCDLQPYEA